MPNHCTNKLTLVSNTKTLGEVLQPYMTKAKQGDTYFLDFEKIIHVPYPINHLENLNGLDFDWQAPDDEKLPEWFKVKSKALYDELAEYNKKTFGFSSAYDFHCEKWDTKWNSYETYYDESVELNEIDYLDFQTAWSPPINIIRELSKLTGESFRMSYYDEGWMFGGVYHVSPQEEKDECYDDPKKCPDDLREELDVDFHLQMREEAEEL